MRVSRYEKYTILYRSFFDFIITEDPLAHFLRNPIHISTHPDLTDGQNIWNLTGVVGDPYIGRCQGSSLLRWGLRDLKWVKGKIKRYWKISTLAHLLHELLERTTKKEISGFEDGLDSPGEIGQLSQETKHHKIWVYRSSTVSEAGESLVFRAVGKRKSWTLPRPSRLNLISPEFSIPIRINSFSRRSSEASSFKCRAACS